MHRRRGQFCLVGEIFGAAKIVKFAKTITVLEASKQAQIVMCKKLTYILYLVKMFKHQSFPSNIQILGAKEEYSDILIEHNSPHILYETRMKRFS